MSKLEPRLFGLISDSGECAKLEIRIEPSPRYGMQISRRGTVMGVWSERDGRLGFRNLSSWQVRHWAASPEEALAITLEMAHRNDWLS